MSFQSARRSAMGFATVSIAEQGDAAHNERIDRRRQVVATGEPARRHRAAVAHGAECLGQRAAADAVHDGGPQLGAEGAAIVLSELAPDDP